MNVDQRAAAIAGQHRRERLGDSQRTEVVGLEHSLDVLDVTAQQLRRAQYPGVVDDDLGIGGQVGQCRNGIGVGDVEGGADDPRIRTGLRLARRRVDLGGARCNSSSTMALPRPRCPPVTTTVAPSMLTMMYAPLT